MEPWSTVGLDERWESIVDTLDRDNGVLVRWPEGRAGIATTMDVVQHLRQIAGDFMLLAEVELALRRLIQTCVPADQLAVCIAAALGDMRGTERIAQSLDQLDFGGYAAFVSETRNWRFFAPVMGDSEVLRLGTRDRIDRVRQLRNDVFHLKRQLTEKEQALLVEERSWLDDCLTMAKAHRAPSATVEPWNQKSFLRALQATSGRDGGAVAERCLAWAKQNRLRVLWGKGRSVGILHIRDVVARKQVFVFSIWSNGDVQLPFRRYAGYPHFREVEERQELLRRLNAVDSQPLVPTTDAGQLKEPAFNIQRLYQPTALDAFLKVFDWFVAEVRRPD
jgi:hypothetical protein